MTYEDYIGHDDTDEISKLAKRLTDEIGADKLEDVFAEMKQALVQNTHAFFSDMTVGDFTEWYYAGCPYPPQWKHKNSCAN